MKNNYLSLVLTLALLMGAGLACSETRDRDGKNTSSPPAARADKGLVKAAEETIRGFHFIYYKIPAGLNEQELIETAQKLHDTESDAQLILVDDDSELEAYVSYTRAISSGNYEAEMPKEWAEKHIVANVQKYMSGKFMLCKGAGYKEIAELK